MIACPNCHHEEIDGILFCSMCNTKICDSVLSVPEDQAFKDQNKANQIPFPGKLPVTNNGFLALRLVDTGEIITITDKKDIAIGRATEGQMIVPDIDLTPFDAYDAGVSRLHVNIIIGESKITVQDLESANGTRLNDVKIASHIKHKLEHGNILTLGTFKIQVLTR